MTGHEPKCYQCGKSLPHSPGVRAPNLCACESKSEKRKPELHIVDGSEITACVDLDSVDDDQVMRPVFINQEGDCLYLTLADARRLHEFLSDAVPYLELVQNLEH